MKYWLLTSEYPPFFGGGIGTYCAATAQMLTGKGHEVSVFINDATVNDIAVSKEKGIRVIRFNTSRTGSSSFLGHTTNISYEFAHIVKHFIEKEGKPDCIESQEYLGIAYYLLQFKLLLYDWCRDIPVLITLHSPSLLYLEYNQVPVYRYPNFWVGEMEWFCLQAADQVISPSHYMLGELKKKIVLRNKNVAVIPNPFEGKSVNLTPLPVTGDQVNEIVFYGKLSVQKGALKLLSYFTALWDKGFNKPLYLVGGQDIIYHPEGITMGDFVRKKYKNQIDASLLKLEDRIRPDDIANRLARAAVVIIPSDNDNLPYVVFEMMALGRIVLVSKQGGQAEIVEDGIDGFVFDHNEPGSFSRQLHKILELDDAQKKLISERAIKKVADNYNADVIYQRKLPVLENILLSAKTSRTNFPFIRELTTVKSEMATSFQKGRLSIVVPYFNMGRYVDDAIKSLLNSKYPDKEILIINDGSTDQSSIDKLNSYRNTEGVRVIDSENGGLGKARNLGAEQATGEFLAFLDADDTVQPEYYDRCIAVFQQYTNVFFAGCWVQYFDGSQKVWPTFTPEPPLILYHNLINTSSLVYRRDAFLAGGKNDTAMEFPGLEDYESVISMLDNGFHGVVVPEILFHYRVRSDSMIRGISKAKKLHLYKHINNKHREFYATFAADLFNLLNANGPGIGLDNPSLDHHLTDRMPFGGRMSGMVIGLIKRNRLAKTIAYKMYKLLKK